MMCLAPIAKPAVSKAASRSVSTRLATHVTEGFVDSCGLHGVDRPVQDVGVGDQVAAGSQDSTHLRERGEKVGQDFDHVATPDGVDAG